MKLFRYQALLDNACLPEALCLAKQPSRVGNIFSLPTGNTPMITGSTPKGGQNAVVVSYPEQRSSDGISPTLRSARAMGVDPEKT